ncbi:MAG: phosphatase PAP2 family protein [Thaumarchaeota archaeon]|nr:phosphatase PAP2 family protein [Nitrososphaerota archaeon]
MKYYIAGIVLFAIFAALALFIEHDNSLTKWDYSAFASINNPQGKIINEIMITFTKYGREVVWIATTALLFIFGGKEGRRAASLLVMAFIILIPLGTALKDEIDRPRPTPVSPDNMLVKADTDPSFPSGHALIVSAGAFIMLARFNRGRQIIPSLILTVEAFLVIYSRVYVGDHYPLDVIGGTLVGTGVSSIVVGFSRYLNPIFSRLDSIRKK